MEWKGKPGWQQYGPRFIVRSTIIKSVLREFHEGIKVLDIGCGKGTFTEILVKKGFQVDAIDSSNEAIEYSLKKLKKYENINIFVGDFMTINTEKKYDLITILEVLEHIKNDSKALIKIHNLLNTEGKIIVSVPAHPQLWNPEDDEACHIRRYTKKELKEKLKDSNFRIEKFFSWGFPITILLFKLEILLMKHKDSKFMHDVESNPIKNLFRLLHHFFYLIAYFESYFSCIDKGIGYIVVCRKN